MTHCVQIPDPVWRRAQQLAGTDDPQQFIVDAVVEAMVQDRDCGQPKDVFFRTRNRSVPSIVI